MSNNNHTESFLIQGDPIHKETQDQQTKREAALIRARLEGVMASYGQFTPINQQLAELMADWAFYRQLLNKSASCSTNDWDVQFLRRMLKGKVKDFVRYCKKYPDEKTNLALSGIMSVYDYKWPHSSATGYIFGFLWGWLQLELEKPGEEKPMTEEEQRESLKKHADEHGETIDRFIYDGFGGVKAIHKENDEFSKEKPKTNKKKEQ